MRADVCVIGEGLAGAALRSRLGGSPLVGSRSAIVADWSDVHALRRLSSEMRMPWALVEDAGNGDVALGPVFRPGYRGCLDCYLARRRANGGRECRPVAAIAGRALELLEHSVANMFSDESRLFGDQIVLNHRGESKRHVFLPVPGCSFCGHARVIEREVAWAQLVSDRVGLVHEVRNLAGAPAPLTAVLAAGCRTDAFWKRCALNRGMAVDDDPVRARRRAVGESLERYCAAAVPEELLFTVAGDLDGPYLPPWRFGALERPWSARTSVLGWVRARHLTCHSEIWVPASAVYVPYVGRPGEPVIDPQSSVGLAAHTAIDEAIYNAVAEVIERDTCLRAWRLDLPVETVPWQFLDTQGLRIVRVPGSSALNVVVSFLESDEVPYTSTGLAARPTLGDAARHATLEAVLSRLWLRERLATQDQGDPWRPPRTMVDHAVAHAVRADLRSSRRRWLDAAPITVADDSGASWAHIVGQFPEAVAVDLTTADVASAGIRVVRVLVPDKVLCDDDALRPRLTGSSTPHPFG